jgi:hypothetical protein
LGLYVEDDTVTLSRVVSTPVGPKEVLRETLPVSGESLPEVLERLTGLPKRGSRFGRTPIAIGLPPGRTYSATRPIQKVGGDPSPHVLLREALRSSRVPVHEMAVDVVEAEPDNRPVASIVAAKQKHLQGLVDALRKYGVRPVRTEAAACALLRNGSSRHRARRGARVVLRVFLSDTQVLVALVAKDLPVVWRYLDLPRGDEAATILSASRSLLTVGKDCGVTSRLDAIVLHGRPDLKPLLDTAWLAEQLGAQIDWHDRPSLDRSEVAIGLALSCFNRDDRTPDLTRKLVPQASLREIFPWPEAVLHVVVLVCMAMFLATRCQILEDTHAAVREQNAQHAWAASLRKPQLEKEKRDLQQQVAAVRKFLNGRVTWTDYIRDVSDYLPSNLFLTSFEGRSKLGSAKNKKAKSGPEKSLVLRGAASMAEDGSVPQEIDQFLNAVREHPSLRDEFPVVELADLKQSRRGTDETLLASFTITCVPKGPKSPNP